jgi:hypothetical protein
MALYSMDLYPMASLFGEEADSLLAVGQDDFLKGQGSLELGNSTGNLDGDLQEEMSIQTGELSTQDALPDWMSEKISLDQWIDAADIMPTDLLTDVPSSFPKVAPIDPTTEELLKALMVDATIPPQPPSPGEQQAPDLLALSPAGCLSSPEAPLSPVSSLSSAEQWSPTPAPLSAEEQLWQIAEGLATVDNYQVTQDNQTVLTDLQPESPQSLASLTSPSTPDSPEEDREDADYKACTASPRKSRAKPKLKGVSDPTIKKIKKRDQNKEAATRYRHKKRREADSILTEEMELEGKNKELKDKVESLSREIKYLKDLMAEVNKVKGELKILRK